MAPSPYDVLGVGQDATQADIRKAYQEALRARAHSRPVVTQAFNQLRNPQNRLAADLLEPPPEPAPDGPAPAPRSFVDAGSAPLPDWTALIAPDAAAGSREIGEPPEDFRAPASGPPPRGVVPPTEFPV